MQIKDFLSYPSIPINELEILLSSVLKKDRSFLIAFPETLLNSKQIAKLKDFIERRKSNEPIAYILGYKDFFGLRFLVNKDVLIPREETEDLVEAVLKEANKIENPTIVDIGTGSGCIAISLAKHLPKTRIIATDISQPALKVAQKNASLHNLLKRITFVETNLIDDLNEKIDLVVANLPYIPTMNYLKLPAEIKDFEPKLALDSGDSKETLYYTLFEQAKRKMKNTGKILYEIDGKVFTKTF